MKISWPVEALQLAIIVAMFLAAAFVWPHAPERIPTHWNLQGEVDGYGGKTVGLLLLPAMVLGLYLLLLFLPRLDPGYRNYQSFEGAYQIIRVALVLFMAGVYAITVLVALGEPINVSTTISIATGVLMAVLGNLMGKIRPNWFVGVRTPWTLSSKLSWTKTHRLAGWLFIAMGLLIATAGIVRTDWMLYVAMVFGGVCIVWLFIYSYLIYRRDPERISPAGTTPG